MEDTPPIYWTGSLAEMGLRRMAFAQWRTVIVNVPMISSFFAYSTRELDLYIGVFDLRFEAICCWHYICCS